MNYANNQKYDMYAVHQDSGSLDVMIVVIVDELAPELIKRNAIGYKSASQLLTAWDNPQRLRTE